MSDPQGLAPIPQSALRDNEALLEWAEPLLLHGVPHSLLAQTWFYIALKAVIVVVSVLLFVRLFRSGRFWLFRVVQLPNGRIICPNAVDSLVFLAAIFYVLDAVFRGLSTRWLFPPFDKEVNIMAFVALRLYPLWLAGFTHLSSLCLIWPFSTERLSPFWWHVFFFGLPLAFLIAYFPPAIISNSHYNAAIDGWYLVRGKLIASPSAQVTQESIEAATALHVNIVRSYEATAIWAGVGSGFLAFLFVMSLVVGTKLLWRASRELRARRQEARSSFRRKSFSSIELQARSRDIESSDHTQPNAEVNISKQRRRKSINKFKTSRGRLIQYFAGIRPLVADEEDDVDSASRGTNEGSEEHRETNASSSEQLPDAAITELLANFFRFTLLQIVCLLCIELALLVVIIYLCATVIEAAKTNRRDEEYGNELSKIGYIYHTVEIWAIIIFGSPLIVSMLFRSAFPYKIDAPSRFSSGRSSSGNAPTLGVRLRYYNRQKQQREFDDVTVSSGSRDRRGDSINEQEVLQGTSVDGSNTATNKSTDIGTADSSSRKIHLSRGEASTGSAAHDEALAKEHEGMGSMCKTITGINEKHHPVGLGIEYDHRDVGLSVAHAVGRTATRGKSQHLLQDHRPSDVIRADSACSRGSDAWLLGNTQGSHRTTPELTKASPKSPSAPVQQRPRDVSWVVGYGSGRSVVLDALEQGHAYRAQRRQRKSPWSNDVEDNLSTLTPSPPKPTKAGRRRGVSSSPPATPTSTSRSFFATPHGPVEGTPLSPLTKTDDYALADSSHPASSPRTLSKYQQTGTPQLQQEDHLQHASTLQGKHSGSATLKFSPFSSPSF